RGARHVRLSAHARRAGCARPRDRRQLHTGAGTGAGAGRGVRRPGGHRFSAAPASACRPPRRRDLIATVGAGWRPRRSPRPALLSRRVGIASLISPLGLPSLAQRESVALFRLPPCRYLPSRRWGTSAIRGVHSVLGVIGPRPYGVVAAHPTMGVGRAGGCDQAAYSRTNSPTARKVSTGSS